MQRDLWETFRRTLWTLGIAGNVSATPRRQPIRVRVATDARKQDTMAVFYDTGGGDIYAGPDRESIIKAMREDIGDDDFDEALIEEVSGDTKMNATDENEQPTGDLISLEDEYGDDALAYCICSNNC